MQYTTIIREVRYNKFDRDFDAYLNGQFVGSRETRVEAEELLDAEAYKLLMLECEVA